MPDLSLVSLQLRGKLRRYVFPLHARDVLEVPECSFTFADDLRPAPQGTRIPAGE